MLTIDQMPYVDLILEDDGTYTVRYTEDAALLDVGDMLSITYYMLEDAREAMYQMSDQVVTGDVQ